MILLTGGGLPLLRFDRGDAFPGALGEWCAAEGVQGAVILCGVGMLEGTELGVFDGTRYARRTFPEPMEVLSLQGNVSMRDGAPFAHVHATLGDHNFECHGGHLFGGVVAVTLEVCLNLVPEGLRRAPAQGPFRPLERAKGHLADT